MSHSKVPSAFICHASEDKQFAQSLADKLLGNGINAWIDKYEIKPGDSLCQKIEDGITDADFFIALVSKNSIREKSWVNHEIDAAFIRKLERKVVIIPLIIMGISNDDIPLFFRSIRYITTENANYLQEIVDTCFGYSSKPPVADVPNHSVSQKLNLLPSSYELALLINRKCQYGCAGEKSFSIVELAKEHSKSPNEVVLMVTDLESHGYITYSRVVGSYGYVIPKTELFYQTDAYVHKFNTEDDSKEIVAYLLNSNIDQISCKDLCEGIGWGFRRLNPAISFLINTDSIGIGNSKGAAPYVTSSIWVTERTRLFGLKQ